MGRIGKPVQGRHSRATVTGEQRICSRPTRYTCYTFREVYESQPLFLDNAHVVSYCQSQEMGRRDTPRPQPEVRRPARCLEVETTV